MTSSTPSPQTAADGQPATALAGALGRIPSGLFVVAWRDGEVDRAMLASWVMQAGFAPPMVSVAVASGRDLLAAVTAGRAFTVNVLADGQRSLLARFGKPADGGDPFAGLPMERAACGAVILGGAAAWLECRPVATSAPAVGDHVVVVAEVVAGGSSGEVQPLVHVRKNGLRY